MMTIHSTRMHMLLFSFPSLAALALAIPRLTPETWSIAFVVYPTHSGTIQYAIPNYPRRVPPDAPGYLFNLKHGLRTRPRPRRSLNALVIVSIESRSSSTSRSNPIKLSILQNHTQIPSLYARSERDNSSPAKGRYLKSARFMVVNHLELTTAS
jgi:hypothetical protein